MLSSRGPRSPRAEGSRFLPAPAWLLVRARTQVPRSARDDNLIGWDDNFSEGVSGLLLLFHFPHAYDLGRGAELSVVAIFLIAVDVVALQQGHAGVKLEGHVPGQPDFV